MTLHSNHNWYSEFNCPQCNALYVPYSKEVCCPKCGKCEEKDSDFIRLAISSIRFNRQEFQSYVPDAWYTGCFSDHILQLLFHIFEAYRLSQDSSVEFKSFVERWISKVDFGEHDYTRQHLLNAALDVYKILNSEEIFIIDVAKKKGFLESIKTLFVKPKTS